MNPARGWMRFWAGALAGLVAGLLLARTPHVGAAQGQRRPTELEIGGEMVALGSQKTQLISRLSKVLDLEKADKFFGGVEYWHVKAKDDPSAFVGGLQFKDDVLIRASREWDHIEPDARMLTFMKSFHGAVERIFGNGTQQAGLVRCTLLREPGDEHFQIDLSMAGHSASLALVEDSRADGKVHRMSFVDETVER